MAASNRSFEDVWRSCRDHLWRIAWLICNDADLADDIVAAAVARSWRRWDQLTIDDPEAYLRRAVVNEATDRLRGRGRDRRWAIRRTGDGRGQYTVIDAAVDRTDLAGALEKLPVGQRAVIVLRYWADLTEQATAEALDVSVGTVKSRTSRALATLAVDLGRPSHDTA
ncbi:MAG: sigma-70 family RNA polymerase sigma factor, partial [Acidimicrobiia bacterium]|nr:sigma-70 family RNA polymerase sigma factor [Acidimicrobiia bacterium]